MFVEIINRYEKKKYPAEAEKKKLYYSPKTGNMKSIKPYVEKSPELARARQSTMQAKYWAVSSPVASL